MKKVIIKNAGVQTHAAELKDPTAWIAECVASNAWGRPERWVIHKDEPMAESYDEADVLEERIDILQPAVDAVRELVSPAIPAVDAVLDEQGIEISPATPAVDAVYAEVSPAVPVITQKMVKLKAEYTIEIEDITAQVEQQKINEEALAYLASTDWMIIRAIDSGVPCPEEVKQARAEARAKIVR